MKQSHPNLGLHFSANQLFYAVNEPGQPGRLARIGSVDFNFNVSSAVIQGDGRHFNGVQTVIRQLKEQFDIRLVRMVSAPFYECWTSFPKLVYDKADEREAHLGILMKGLDRSQILPTWYSLSNADYKFLVIRNQAVMEGFEQLAGVVSTSEFVSDFELGQRWIQHHDASGSFLTISCYNDLICVSSFLLGKLRGATYIKFESLDDLPYLWLQVAEHLKWMKGLHEQVYVYGLNAYQVVEILRPYMDDASDIIRLDTLRKMTVEAEEETYGFNLERAFPAILLALEL